MSGNEAPDQKVHGFRSGNICNLLSHLVFVQERKKRKEYRAEKRKLIAEHELRKRAKTEAQMQLITAEITKQIAPVQASVQEVKDMLLQLVTRVYCICCIFLILRRSPHELRLFWSQLRQRSRIACDRGLLHSFAGARP